VHQVGYIYKIIQGCTVNITYKKSITQVVSVFYRYICDPVQHSGDVTPES